MVPARCCLKSSWTRPDAHLGPTPGAGGCPDAHPAGGWACPGRPLQEARTTGPAPDADVRVPLRIDTPEGLEALSIGVMCA